ncbi:MAG: RluA family pseudouridine synthase [Polyangiales bacterium]
MAWTVETPNVTLAAFVKAKTNVANSVAKRQIETGKVFVDGAVITEVAHRLEAGQSVEVKANAPKPFDATREGVLVYDDAHVVVIDKPTDVNSVPYEDEKSGTAMDLIRGAWRRQGKPATSVPLHVVHRIDRATSGLLMFAKTKQAEMGLAAPLRAHSLERMYRCVAHGTVMTQRIESYLVPDRGDGMRGSTKRIDQGKRAITHVTADRALVKATLCSVRLETGKTHQIRIHLAETGHPLVGETVYIRDYEERGGKLLTSGRLMLHAATLGFEHPVTGERVSLSSELPPDFMAVVQRFEP